MLLTIRTKKQPLPPPRENTEKHQVESVEQSTYIYIYTYIYHIIIIIKYLSCACGRGRVQKLVLMLYVFTLQYQILRRSYSYTGVI